MYDLISDDQKQYFIPIEQVKGFIKPPIEIYASR